MAVTTSKISIFSIDHISVLVKTNNPIIIGAVLRSNVIMKFSPQTPRISDVLIFLNFKGE